MQYCGLVALLHRFSAQAPLHTIFYEGPLLAHDEVEDRRQLRELRDGVAADLTEGLVGVDYAPRFYDDQALPHVALGLQKRLVEAPLVADLLPPLAFGDVPGNEHHSLDGRIVQQVVGDPFEVTPGAVLMPMPPLRFHYSPRLTERFAKFAEYLLGIVGVDVLASVGPDHLFGAVAQHPLVRRANVAQDPIGIRDHEYVRRVLDEKR